MAASTSVTFWAFVRYLKSNRHKAAGSMTNDDIDNMAEAFAAANSTEITDATDPGGTYTDVEWPDKNGGASSITATSTNTDRAWYPEQHKGS